MDALWILLYICTCSPVAQGERCKRIELFFRFKVKSLSQEVFDCDREVVYLVYDCDAFSVENSVLDDSALGSSSQVE